MIATVAANQPVDQISVGLRSCLLGLAALVLEVKGDNESELVAELTQAEKELVRKQN